MTSTNETTPGVRQHTEGHNEMSSAKDSPLQRTRLDELTECPSWCTPMLDDKYVLDDGVSIVQHRYAFPGGRADLALTLTPDGDDYDPPAVYLEYDNDAGMTLSQANHAAEALVAVIGFATEGRAIAPRLASQLACPSWCNVTHPVATPDSDGTYLVHHEIRAGHVVEVWLALDHQGRDVEPPRVFFIRDDAEPDDDGFLVTAAEALARDLLTVTAYTQNR